MTMFSTTTESQTDPIRTERPALSVPAEVSLVLSALEAGRHGRGATDRRINRRHPLRATSVLRLYADAHRPPITVYTRDVGGRNVGFVTRERLPLGYGGTIELPGPDGDPARIACVLLRCSPSVQGWYDASAAFNRLQPQFE